MNKKVFYIFKIFPFFVSAKNSFNYFSKLYL